VKFAVRRCSDRHHRSELRRVFLVLGSGGSGQRSSATGRSRVAPLGCRTPAGVIGLGGATTTPENRLGFHFEPEAAVPGAEFIHENAPEPQELKRKLLCRIDAVLPPSVIIASSSSGLLTAPTTVERAGGLCGARQAARSKFGARSTGTSPIGLPAALWREAVYLLAKGVASAADYRTVISDGPRGALGADGAVPYFSSSWRPLPGEAISSKAGGRTSAGPARTLR
jgi:hypothetical protein